MIESQVKISDYKDHPVKYAKTALELDAINKQKALLKRKIYINLFI